MKSRRKRSDKYVAGIGETRNTHLLFVKSEMKGPLDRPKHGWEDHFIMDVE
jgi:hypothetical protein